MSNTDIAKQWNKNERETYRICLERYRGRDVISLRVWFTNADGELLPGRSGINFNPTELDNMIAGLKRARKRAVRRGLLASDK